MIKIELYSGEVILTQRAIDEGGKGLYVPRRRPFPTLASHLSD